MNLGDCLEWFEITENETHVCRWIGGKVRKYVFPPGLLRYVKWLQ